jgi:branched-chain amino acid transport system permease protein
MADIVSTSQAAAAGTRSPNLARAVRETILWTLVTAVLCIPLLTLITAEDFNRLKLLQRWWVPAVAMGIVAPLRFITIAFADSEAAGGLFESLQWYARRAFVALGAWFLIGLVVRLILASFGSTAETTNINSLVLLFAASTTAFLISGPAGEATYGALARWLPRVYGAAMLLGAVLLPFLPFTDRYILDTSILIITYIMLGWGLNIVVGLAGLLDLGYVAFYGIGAYSYALLAEHFGFNFWICLPLAGILAAFWGVILGFPVLRLRGDYLAIVTLAFGEIIRLVLINWFSFTHGPQGVSNIPRPSFFGLEFKSSGPGSFAEFFHLTYTPLQRIIWLYYIILAMALVTNMVSKRLRRLPIGRAWEALREDEIACRSLGINTTTTKLTAFAIGAGFGGFAGAFFATKQGFISPESFNFLESATILAIVVLGGLGSQLGIVLSSIVMIGGIEVLRNLDFLKSFFGNDFDPIQYRMLLFGLALVMIMIWRPRGIVSTRTPSISIGKGHAISGDLVKEGHG